MEMSYSGIGSRETPNKILILMREFGYQMAIRNLILRSGAAKGADTAFELGAMDGLGKMEIFLAKKLMFNHPSQLYDIPQAAFDIAREIHPVFNSLKYCQQRLMARNVQQICGAKLNDKSKFVICWTKDWCESHKTYSRSTGGTGLAIALASLLDIPVFNIANPIRLNQAYQYAESLIKQ